MAHTEVKLSDCEFEEYDYLLQGDLKGKDNYIPFYVLKIPYTKDEFLKIYNNNPRNAFYISYDGGNTSVDPKTFYANEFPEIIGNPTWMTAITQKINNMITVSYKYAAYNYEDDLIKIYAKYPEDLTNKKSATFAMQAIYNGKNLGNINTSYMKFTYTIEPSVIATGYSFYVVTTNDYSLFLTYNDETWNVVNYGNLHNLYDVKRHTESGRKGFVTGNDIEVMTVWHLYPWANNSYSQWLRAVLGKCKKLDHYDPNPGGGDSKPCGGGGDGDIGGDTNPDDGLPTISALDSGLLTAYNPNVGQLQSLGRFLWSDSFNLDSFKKLFNDPFDTLLGLSVVPVKPNTSRTQTIMFGNLDSGVSAPVVSNQWVHKDMGSVALNEVWKGALDYAPSTSVTIYLPFIGMRQLNVNDVMGSTLQLIYKFDVLTGSCIAQIYVNHSSQGNKNDGFSWSKNQGLLYEFIGQCAENIPLASQDFTNTIRAAIGGVAVATGAAASIATGNPALGIAGLTVGAANLGMQASTPTVERGGHLSGSASILGYSQPFLIVERPHQCKPSKYYALRGVPSQVYTSKLSNCTNFTQITANNNLHIAGATDTELTELQNLLVAGIYFPNKKR